MRDYHPPTTSHNYMRKVLALGGLVPPGALADIDTLHDDWCDVYHGGFCNCDPDVTIRAPIKPAE
jgi:hypothetical protein